MTEQQKIWSQKLVEEFVSQLPAEHVNHVASVAFTTIMSLEDPSMEDLSDAISVVNEGVQLGFFQKRLLSKVTLYSAVMWGLIEVCEWKNDEPGVLKLTDVGASMKKKDQ